MKGRAVFETWAKENCISLSTNWDGDEYDYPTTKFAYWGWNAALDKVIKGLRSEEQTVQVRAIIASVEHMKT